MNTLRRSTPVTRVLLWFLLLVQAARSQAADSTVEPVQFNRDIRPILSENCFQCHGPDEGTRESDLRLDNKAGIFQPAEGVSATVVPGNLAASHLYQRITSDDLDQRMPPVDSRWSLTNQQIDLLRRRIEQGATWEGHWSYIPPRRPAVPGVRDVAWPQGPVDRFVLQEIESHSMSPSPSASTVTLLRRLRFDLTGLPPRPELLDAYLGDDHPAAYERLVDRLLASPNLGERLAMYWLDLVRYADSVGYHGDLVKFMHTCCGLCDRPSAALVRDLKQRGLLEDTLIIWGGEFGRTPMYQGKGKQPGRDHHIRGFSLWMAGGGIRPGMTYGATDDLGYHAVENRVEIHDLHATMLHLLGIDHEQLIYRFQGRDFRLTDVAGNVVRDILV